MKTNARNVEWITTFESHAWPPFVVGCNITYPFAYRERKTVFIASYVQYLN